MMCHSLSFAPKLEKHRLRTVFFPSICDFSYIWVAFLLEGSHLSHATIIAIVVKTKYRTSLGCLATVIAVIMDEFDMRYDTIRNFQIR